MSVLPFCKCDKINNQVIDYDGKLVRGGLTEVSKGAKITKMGACATTLLSLRGCAGDLEGGVCHFWELRF